LHQAQLTLTVSFYPRDAILARVLAMTLCPCLSVTSRCSIEMHGLIFGRFLSTYPTLCSKEIQVSTGTYAAITRSDSDDSTSSRTLSQTPDLYNFASAYRSSKRVINLARQGGRSKHNKLDRRWSAKLTMPPSSDARPLVFHR